MNIIRRTSNEEDRTILQEKLYKGSLFWKIKVDLLKNGVKTVGPMNSVIKYSCFAANHLWKHNKLNNVLFQVSFQVFGTIIPMALCNLISLFTTKADAL